MIRIDNKEVDMVISKAQLVRPAIVSSLSLLISALLLCGCYATAARPATPLPAATARPTERQLTEKHFQLYPADEISVIKVNLNEGSAPGNIDGVIVFQTNKDAVQTNLAVSVNGVLHITALAKDEKGWRIGDAGEVSFVSPDSFEFTLNNPGTNASHTMRIACSLSNNDFTFKISTLD